MTRSGQSFSDVVLENLHPLADTCGEVREIIERNPPPAINLARIPKAMKRWKRHSRR